MEKTKLLYLTDAYYGYLKVNLNPDHYGLF